MRTHRRRHDNDIVLKLPAWISRVYVAMAVVLVPWTIYLGLTLPKHHLSSHWDISWTGLDVGIIVALLATGILAYIRSIWLVIASVATGSLVLVDAWFDVMSERSPSDFHQALILAIVFEIPLALLSFYLAVHTLKSNALPRVVKRR